MTDLLTDLSRKLDTQRAALKKADQYYEGEQPIAYLADEVREMVGDRLADVVLNWPEVVVDSLEQRLDVEGFRLGGATEANDELWQEWQRNGLDEESSTVHVESMLYGYTAVSVWAHDDDESVPVISTETPSQVAFDYDPATRRRRAALKRWVDGDDAFATLYLPDRLVKRATKATAGSLVAPVGGWTAHGPDVPNPLGVVPLVPFRNKARTTRPDGRSELASIYPLADVINKLATDLMVTAEFHALPLRYMTNLLLTTDPGDQERLREQVKQYMDALPKGRTRIGGQGVEFGQLEAADLANFVSAIRMFVGFLAAIGAMPPHEVGITTENPASADAIRSSETLKVKRAERKQRSLGGSWEDVMRLTAAVKQKVPVVDLPAEYDSMETVWRDAATPTVAQSADAAVKLVEVGLLDIEAGQERIGLSPVQRKNIAYRKAASAAADATADVEARLALARRLEAEDGLTKNAALAAAGLLAAAAANAEPAQ